MCNEVRHFDSNENKDEKKKKGIEQKGKEKRRKRAFNKDCKVCLRLSDQLKTYMNAYQDS